MEYFLKNKYIVILLFLGTSCTATGYRPSYLTTDQPVIQEVKAGDKESQKVILEPIR